MTTLYTDGSFRRGHGGIGVWFGDGDPRNVSEAFTDRPTNQRCELAAVRKALSLTDGPVTIRTDSRYVIGCLTEWYPRWRANGWRNSRGEPVANQDLIRPTLDLVRAGVVFEHVKAHCGEPGNEGADRLANAGALTSASVHT